MGEQWQITLYNSVGHRAVTQLGIFSERSQKTFMVIVCVHWTEEYLPLMILTLPFIPSFFPVLPSFLSLSLTFWKRLNSEFSPSSTLTLSSFLLIHTREHPITPTETVFPLGDHLVLKRLQFLCWSNKIIRENSVLPIYLFSTLISTKVIYPIKWLQYKVYFFKSTSFCFL